MTTYTGDRPEILRFCDFGFKTVLDVGCGEGGLARHLRDRAAAICGIEPEPSHAGLASEQYDDFYGVRVEEALDGPLRGRSFDLIIVADVLEHLVDPWTVTQRLVDHLGPNGKMMISVPNVGNVVVLKQLLRHGDWRYDDADMFDRTHLRWFGRQTLRELMAGAGLRPERWGARLSIAVKAVGTNRLVDNANHIPSLAIYQHHILARRARGAEQDNARGLL